MREQVNAQRLYRKGPHTSLLQESAPQSLFDGSFNASSTAFGCTGSPPPGHRLVQTASPTSLNPPTQSLSLFTATSYSPGSSHAWPCPSMLCSAR